MTEQINNFYQDAKTRLNSPTPDFWKKMQPVMGFTFGGITTVQALLPDGTSMWIKLGIAFIAGGLGYFTGSLAKK